MKDKILSALSAAHPWHGSIHWFDSIPSTNDLAKSLSRQGAPHGTVIIAGEQTGGRGRMGRSFHSPAGTGLYMSAILRPDCAPQELMHLTCAAAEAACDAVEHTCGFRPGIKWINDLVWQGRKLGGILTELMLNPDGSLDCAVIGIGINCSQKSADFPDEIRAVACSVAMACGVSPDIASLAAGLTEALHSMSEVLLTGKKEMLSHYRRDCVTLGQDVVLLRGDQRRYGRALDVDESGALTVVFSDGNTEAVSSGEVSIRGMYGYV